MFGSISPLSKFTYPPEWAARLTAKPSGAYYREMADLVEASGMIEYMDPAFYKVASKSVGDLCSLRQFKSAVGMTPLMDGDRQVLVSSAGTDDGLVSERIKAESSWTVMGYVRQYGANQAAVGNKVLYSCGVTNFAFRNRSNSSTFDVMVGGVSVANFVFTTMPRVLLISCDAETNSLSVRETTSSSLDHELVSVTLSSIPANGAAWEIGGGEGAIDFDGIIGETAIFDKALAHSDNETVRQRLQAVMARRYSLQD